MDESPRKLPDSWRHAASIVRVPGSKNELVSSYLYSKSSAPIRTSQTHTIFDVVIDDKVEFFIRKAVMFSKRPVYIVDYRL